MMEAQIVGDLCHQGVEHGIAGEAEDVVGVVILSPVHRLDAAVVTVAAPDDAGFGQCRFRRFVTCLITVLTSVPLSARRAQDRHHRGAARHVIDVHRREAALVMMGVPERKLLTAMRRAEGVVDIEDLERTRLHGGAELVNESCGEPRRLGLARRILQTADGRLRGQRRAALRTAPDRKLHQRIMPQPIEVDPIFIAARNRRRHAPSPFRTSRAGYGSHRGDPASHPQAGGTPRACVPPPQQQKAGIGGLVAAIKINCEILAADRWKVKGKRRIVEHGGCGAGQIHIAIRRNTDLLRELRSSRYGRRKILAAGEFSRLVRLGQQPDWLNPITDPGAEHLMVESGGLPQRAVIELSLRRVWRHLLAKIEAHRQMVLVDVGVHAPISSGMDFQLLQNGNDSVIEVERDTFTEHVKRDNLHVMRISHGAPPAERQGIHRLKSRRDASRLDALHKSTLFHPGDELIGMVCFLDSVFGKHRLEALVPAKRVTQAERLRKFARLMNQLMDPPQIIGSAGPGKVDEKRALSKLRSVVLRVIKQPLHRG